MQGKGLSGRNWMRVNVLLLVSKKLSAALLIIDLLDPFAPKDLIALLSPLLWELLGASWWLGIHPFFWGTVIEIQPFAILVEFVSKQNNEKWSLVSVYGPCQGEARDNFVSWLYNLQIPMDDNWLLVGDFNFIRSLENRNLPGGI